VPGPGLLDRPAKGAQRLPATLLRYGGETKLGRHHRRHLLCGPKPAIVGRALQPLAHHIKDCRRQDRRLGAVAAPPVAQT